MFGSLFVNAGTYPGGRPSALFITSQTESLSPFPGCSTKLFRPCKILNTNWTGSSMVEQLTLNQRVGGSRPPRLPKIHTNFIEFVLADELALAALFGCSMALHK